jgi:hypothetical protein
VAKKNTANAERRARVEALRQEQARKERRRTLTILGVCVVVVVGLLAAAVIPYVKHQNAVNKIAATPIDKIGVSASAAGCDAITTKNATGNQQHVNPGTPITYPDAPPAFGKHWGNFLQGSEIRSFYTTSDRPQVERLVHSLEHGHTIAWYDDTVKPGTAAYADLKNIASKLSADSYFMAAPWKSTDGAAFPAGKHVVLTHWTGPSKQLGVWEYCGKPSGAVVKSFLQKYVPTNAPEPGAA